jgi:hypothetical protein
VVGLILQGPERQAVSLLVPNFRPCNGRQCIDEVSCPWLCRPRLLTLLLLLLAGARIHAGNTRQDGAVCCFTY